MNANDIFFLARYAHRVLTPLMDVVDGNLEVILSFNERAPRVQLWVFPNDFSSVRSIAHKTGIHTKEQVDELVAEVKALASVTA